MFLYETVALLGIGCLAGGAMSLAAGRAASASLWCETYDPLIFVLAATLLAAVAILRASSRPSCTRVDPMIALRYE